MSKERKKAIPSVPLTIDPRNQAERELTALSSDSWRRGHRCPCLRTLASSGLSGWIAGRGLVSGRRNAPISHLTRTQQMVDVRQSTS
jgi:hypothetical protein